MGSQVQIAIPAVGIRKLRLSQQTRKSLWAYLFISPFYISFLLFGLFPIAFSFYLAFTRWTPLGGEWVGLRNFENLASDGLFHKAVFNSIWLMLVVTIVQVSIALVVAFVLNSQGVRLKDFYRAALFLPYITSPVVLGLVWSVMLNDHGAINFTLTSLGLPAIDWFGLQSGSGYWIKPAIAMVTVWQYFGWNVILFSAGLQAIPSELYEAARIDGARGLEILRYITLPLLKRVTFFIVSITIIGSIQLFDIPLMLLGGLGGTGQGTLGGAEAGGLTIAMLIYDTAFSYGQFGYAGSMAMVLFAMLIAITFLNRYLFFRDREA